MRNSNLDFIKSGDLPETPSWLTTTKTKWNTKKMTLKLLNKKYG